MPPAAEAASFVELAERLRSQMPASMRERQQWLLWRFEPDPKRPEKPRKVPMYASGSRRVGSQGSERDRERLVTLDRALEVLVGGRYDGVGFAFLPGDGLIGIDIDGAIDGETGEVSERCRSIIEACGSYTEYSPSGRGVHIIVAGQVKSDKDNRIGLEVFCGRQFFTCTGRHWPGAPTEVAQIGDGVLRRLIATIVKSKAEGSGGKAKAPAKPIAPTDDFRRVNAAALALMDSWVPQLFPTARRSGDTGAWRVTSKDLGREREEDLSLHSTGISDFGDEEGLTPIDTVVKFSGRTPRDALVWLAAAVGIQLTKRSQSRSPRAGQAPVDEELSTPSTGSAEEAGSREAAPPPDESWRRQMISGNNGWKDCRENVYLALVKHPALQGLVGYDEFSHRVMKLRPPPWPSETGEWVTNDDYKLGFWLAKQLHLVIKGEGTIVAGVAMAAYDGRFHPVHDYLHRMKAWDGVERLRHWLHECLGAEDSEYSALVGAWFLMGMVQRVLHPGCQMDYMVVLEGLQGKRKSTALRTLVGRDDWFADTPIRLGDKDAILTLAGIWLYEVGELDSFNKVEVTAVKMYVSSRVDRVREPFARRMADRPRSGVFAGSTNQSEYFKDPTGARRFWPVACDGDIDLDKLMTWRDQLFAEAQHRLASEDAELRRYYPTREETDKYLVPQQERREIVDPWFERLALWLSSKATYGESGLEICEVENFTAHELLTKCLMVPIDRIDGGRQMATRVGIAMHKLGWHKKRDADGTPRLYRYWRPQAKVAAAPVGEVVLDEF